MEYVHIVIWVLLVHALYKLVKGTLFEGVHQFYKKLLSDIRPWYVFEGMGLAIANSFLVMELKQIEWMRFSFLSLFGMESQNIIVSLAGSAGVQTYGLGITLANLSVLIILLPVLALIEEWIFRKGYESWAKIAGMSFLFGLVHMLVGVGLGAAISLTLVGLYLGGRYKDRFEELADCEMTLEDRRIDATLRSTLIHYLHNCTIMVLMLIQLLRGV